MFHCVDIGSPSEEESSAEAHLEVGEVLLHEAVDLTDREAARLAVLQSHSNQTTEEIPKC